MSVDHVSLARCRVLYLGSAIPLETAVGIESIQAPCRDRFANNVDGAQRASGIDSVVSVYSSGLMLQYAGDDTTSTWFPIQTLHVCAAVKAVPGSGPLRFVSLDTSTAQRSSNPPMFACIMRRTKGIKVLECHVFICKSNQAAMALVQACTHAFQHKEGWLSSMPSTSARIIAAEDGYKGGKSSARGGGMFSGRTDLVQKFDVSCRMDDKPAARMGGYFADWNSYGGQPMMIVPNSPFYPGAHEVEILKKRCNKKKKCCGDEEVYYVKKSDLSSHCGDSLRSKLRTREEIISEEICYPKPKVVLVPEAQNQQNPKTDVVVYAPQVITANRKTANFNYDDRDNEIIDYRPDDRRYWNNNERRLLDARQDNRVDYQQGYYRKNDYRADQRTLNNRQDNRAIYGYGEEFGDGYYDAQIQDYNNQVVEYNRQLAEYYGDEEDDGYFADDYLTQPGYSDDYGMGYAQDPMGGYVQDSAPQGRYVLDYVDDYVPGYGQPTVAPTACRERYVQVADGLGYYP